MCLILKSINILSKKSISAPPGELGGARDLCLGGVFGHPPRVLPDSAFHRLEPPKGHRYRGGLSQEPGEGGAMPPPPFLRHMTRIPWLPAECRPCMPPAGGVGWVMLATRSWPLLVDACQHQPGAG